MPFELFHDRFPQLAEVETRSITVMPNANAKLPAGQYGFLEMYCNERGCDCRRVFFYVVTPACREPLAVIAYGWEPPEFYAKWMNDSDPQVVAELKGPILNLASPQSNLAEALLDLANDVLLRDAAYVERIKRHYRMFRDAIDGERPRGRGSKKRRKKRSR